MTNTDAKIQHQESLNKRPALLEQIKKKRRRRFSLTTNGFLTQVTLHINWNSARSIAESANLVRSGTTKSHVSPPSHSPNSMSNKIQRNSPCPCKSGKKYKQCCEPKPEKIEARPAAAGGVEYPNAVKGQVPSFTSRTPMTQPSPMPRVQGAFGKPGRRKHPVDYSTVTDPRFLSRAARERLHVSHT